MTKKTACKHCHKLRIELTKALLEAESATQERDTWITWAKIADAGLGDERKKREALEQERDALKVDRNALAHECQWLQKDADAMEQKSHQIEIRLAQLEQERDAAYLRIRSLQLHESMLEEQVSTLMGELVTVKNQLKLSDNPPLLIGALKLGWQALRNLVTTGKLRGK